MEENAKKWVLPSSLYLGTTSLLPSTRWHMLSPYSDCPSISYPSGELLCILQDPVQMFLPLTPFLTKCCSQITSLGFRPNFFLPLLYRPQCFSSCSFKCDFFLKHRICVSALGKLRPGPYYLKQSLSILNQHQSHPEILKHR